MKRAELIRRLCPWCKQEFTLSRSQASKYRRGMVEQPCCSRVHASKLAAWKATHGQRVA